MDIEKLKTLSKRNFNHAVAKKQLHEKIKSQSILAYNGGLFEVNRELYSFIWIQSCMNNTTGQTELILIDSNNNPIKITDLKDFASKIYEKYKEIMNEWHVEYENIKKIRGSWIV